MVVEKKISSRDNQSGENDKFVENLGAKKIMLILVTVRNHQVKTTDLRQQQSIVLKRNDKIVFQEVEEGAWKEGTVLQRAGNMTDIIILK